jgi:hypothetical protein
MQDSYKNFLWLQVVDCRVCGDPNSVLRFAFVEFTDEGTVCFAGMFQSNSFCDQAIMYMKFD